MGTERNKGIFSFLATSLKIKGKGIQIKYRGNTIKKGQARCTQAIQDSPKVKKTKVKMPWLKKVWRRLSFGKKYNQGTSATQTKAFRLQGGKLIASNSALPMVEKIILGVDTACKFDSINFLTEAIP
jgi:hypothetical protein